MKINLFTPHQKQEEILVSILKGNEKYHTAAIGRQFGKSLLGENLVLYWGLKDPGCKILWVSPVYSQANKVQKELNNEASSVIKSNNYSSSEMTLMNGSTIYFRSAERYDNMRGMTNDYAIIDEAAFIKNEAWDEAIRPTLIVRGKRVLFISTPKGKNWFYDMYQLGMSDDHPNYKSYKGSSLDSPYMPVDEINEARKTVPEQIFRQEYLAEFMDGGGEVFSNMRTFDQWPKAKGKIFAGLDIGRQEDFTVLTIMDSTGNVIEVYRDNKQDWSKIISNVLTIVRKHRASLLVEVNGVGDPVFEQIKKQYQDTHPFVTSHKTKNEIIEGLILDFNQDAIAIPSRSLFSHQYHELSVFTYEYSPKTRNVRYGHPVGMHDDTVMSLAICNYHRKKNKSYGSYSIR